MHEQIREQVEAVWRHHLDALAGALDESIRGLLNLLRLDDYHRHGHEGPQLAKALGPFAGAHLNVDALSEVLGKSPGNRTMPDARLTRIRELVDHLKELHGQCAAAPGKIPCTGITDDDAEIHRRAEAHLDRMADVFRGLRVAQLEIHSKYDEAEHGPLFADFNWRRLTTEELLSCPPFVVCGELEGSAVLRKVLGLLESRKPIKVVLLRGRLKKDYPVTADTAVPASFPVEMLPLALRGATFLQSCPVVANHFEQVFLALRSPRPGLLSLLARRAGESEAAFAERAHRALCARAFPAISYDPDRAPGMVACLDLSANPDPQDSIPFADFAAGEPEFAGDFSAPDAGGNGSGLMPVGEYLPLTRRQRIGKRPFVEVAGADGQPARRVVSPALITQISDQRHIWKTLQELAGIDNPYVAASTAALQEKCEQREKELVEARDKALEEDRARIEQAAVAAAVRRLVAHFTGVAPSAIDPERMLRDAGVGTDGEKADPAAAHAPQP